jgi:hypothetical protein
MNKVSFLIFLLIPVAVWAQPVKYAKLKATEGPISIRGYHIERVVDERLDTSNIGTMRAGLMNKITAVNLEDGVTASVTRFIKDFVAQTGESPAVELHVLELKVAETANGIQEKASLVTRYGFYIQGQKLIDYTGSSTARSGLDVSPYIGKLVSRSLEDVLREFERWWSAHKQLYDETAKPEIRVHFADSIPDKDLIAYDAKRPLSWEDFEGRPDDMSKGDAGTYSGFSIQYGQTLGPAGLQVNVELVPFFDKTKSWVKPAGKTSDILRHEQLHFDITVLKAHQLAAAIQSASFSREHFKEELAGLQKKYQREMQDMQLQYDQETQHSLVKKQQILWETSIKSELKAYPAGN